MRLPSKHPANWLPLLGLLALAAVQSAFQWAVPRVAEGERFGEPLAASKDWCSWVSPCNRGSARRTEPRSRRAPDTWLDSFADLCGAPSLPTPWHTSGGSPPNRHHRARVPALRRVWHHRSEGRGGFPRSAISLGSAGARTSGYGAGRCDSGATWARVSVTPGALVRGLRSAHRSSATIWSMLGGCASAPS